MSQINIEETSANTAYYADIPLERLVYRNDYYCKLYSEDLIARFAWSLRRCGQLQPILVRPIEDDKFEVIDGKNRIKAIEINSGGHVWATVRDFDDAMARKLTYDLNAHRL